MKVNLQKATSLIASQLLGQVGDLMSGDTEDHLLLTRQLDDEFQLLAGRMHQLDSHIALDLGNFSLRSHPPGIGCTSRRTSISGSRLEPVSGGLRATTVPPVR